MGNLWRSPKQWVTIFCLNLLLLMGCAPTAAPPATPNPRTFIDMSVDFLDEYRILDEDYAGTKIGGISAINYDPFSGKYYAVSDDRSKFSPARFYTLDIELNESGVEPQFEQIQFTGVTALTDAMGEFFEKGKVDPEGLGRSPRNSLFISSEGVTNRQIDPFVKEFDFDGNELSSLRIPDRFLPLSRQQGIRDNLGFEALAIAAPSIAADDPFRIFVAPESSLIQDTAADPDLSAPIRLLHYVVNPIGDPVLIAEHLYPLEPDPEGAIANGLVELIALPQEGYLLSLERTFGIGGAGAKLFQISLSNATDTYRIESLAGDPETVSPVRKTLLFDLRTLGISLDNLEGMTLGPKFADGSQSLILISDNNFSDDQVNQVLLFRLNNSAASATSK